MMTRDTPISGNPPYIINHICSIFDRMFTINLPYISSDVFHMFSSFPDDFSSRTGEGVDDIFCAMLAACLEPWSVDPGGSMAGMPKNGWFGMEIP